MIEAACQSQSMSRPRSVVAIAVPVVVAISLPMAHGGYGAARGASGPPRGLTKAGVRLWQFEALLHDTFGARAVCEITGGTANSSPLPDSGDFVAPRGGCTPESMYSSYGYVFANASRSPFHLVSRTFKGGAFGNYPEPVRVARMYVACDRAAKTFLISYGDAATFTLDCLAPLP